ncbi:helix-turn-helix transcriptional regulator [Streptomyces sp. SYSU K21746]
MESKAFIRVRRTPPAELGPMLRQARERAQLTQAKAAEAVGVQRPYISKLEDSSRCPSRVVALRLVDILALGEHDAALLLGATVEDAGRSHPRRSPART